MKSYLGRDMQEVAQFLCNILVKHSSELEMGNCFGSIQCFANIPSTFTLCVCFSQISWHIFMLTAHNICGKRSFVLQPSVRKNIVHEPLYVSHAASYLWTMENHCNEFFLLICFDSLKGDPVQQHTVCFSAMFNTKDVRTCLELSTLPLMQ